MKSFYSPIEILIIILIKLYYIDYNDFIHYINEIKLPKLNLKPSIQPMRISAVPHSEGQPIYGSQNPVTKAEGHPALTHSCF